MSRARYRCISDLTGALRASGVSRKGGPSLRLLAWPSQPLGGGDITGLLSIQVPPVSALEFSLSGKTDSPGKQKPTEAEVCSGIRLGSRDAFLPREVESWRREGLGPRSQSWGT